MFYWRGDGGVLSSMNGVRELTRPFSLSLIHTHTHTYISHTSLNCPTSHSYQVRFLLWLQSNQQLIGGQCSLSARCLGALSEWRPGRGTPATGSVVWRTDRARLISFPAFKELHEVEILSQVFLIRSKLYRCKNPVLNINQDFGLCVWKVF